MQNYIHYFVHKQYLDSDLISKMTTPQELLLPPQDPSPAQDPYLEDLELLPLPQSIRNRVVQLRTMHLELINLYEVDSALYNNNIKSEERSDNEKQCLVSSEKAIALELLSLHQYAMKHHVLPLHDIVIYYFLQSDKPGSFYPHYSNYYERKREKGGWLGDWSYRCLMTTISYTPPEYPFSIEQRRGNLDMVGSRYIWSKVND